MSKTIISTVLTALICLSLFAVAGCSDGISIIYITDIKDFSDIQSNTDKIEIDFDNHTGKPFKFTIDDKVTINQIMDIVLHDKLTNIGKEFPPGDNTFMTVYQGENAYRLSVRVNGANGNYYAFSSDLQSKIIDLAIAQGAYDTEVGIIYKIIDMKDIESVKEEKITVADKIQMLTLLENNYKDYKYFYLYDSSDIAEPYYSGITENHLASYQYEDTVLMGENKLLLIYHIYQNYNTISYYITSPSFGEYIDNGNKMYMEFAFGLWHNYYLKVNLVS